MNDANSPCCQCYKALVLDVFPTIGGYGYPVTSFFDLFLYPRFGFLVACGYGL